MRVLQVLCVCPAGIIHGCRAHDGLPMCASDFGVMLAFGVHQAHAETLQMRLYELCAYLMELDSIISDQQYACLPAYLPAYLPHKPCFCWVLPEQRVNK